jgi:HK97 family phage portal protein
MSIFTSMFSVPAQRTYSGVPNSGVIPPLGAVSSASGMMVSQGTAMTVSAVYACVTVRAKDVARCSPRLYKEARNGKLTPAKSTHPVAKLFKRPNRQQTWFEFSRDMQLSYLLRGNAYAAVLRDSAGNPVELIPINPDAVQLLEAANGEIFYSVNRLGLFQIYMLQNFPVTIPEEDILHLRGPSFNILMGASTVGLARDSIGLDMALSQQMSRFVGNGARPSGVLQSEKKLNEETSKRLKASWQQFVGGLNNVGTTAVLEEGIKWQQLQLTSVDMELLQSRTFQVADIARFFDVPLSRLGVAGTTSTKITPAEEEQAYVNHTVMPDLEMWEQKIERRFDLDKSGYKVDLDEAQLLRADIATRYNAARIGVLSGFITPNEIRESEGLDPKPGGDALMVPANTAALGSDMTGTAPDGAGAPAAGNATTPGVATNGDQTPGKDEADPDPQDDPSGEL